MIGIESKKKAAGIAINLIVKMSSRGRKESNQQKYMWIKDNEQKHIDHFL